VIITAYLVAAALVVSVFALATTGHETAAIIVAAGILIVLSTYLGWMRGYTAGYRKGSFDGWERWRKTQPGSWEGTRR
jgi:ABC-type transport system involved in cytochrome c biogenesis permease component